MKWTIVAASALAFMAQQHPTLAASTSEPNAAARPSIHIEDVDRFFRIYDAADQQPTADQLQRDYVDAGSAGLRQFARVRNISGAKIAESLARNPSLYTDARECAAVLPRVRDRLEAAFQELKRIYPEARFPSLTIAIGRGKPVGVGSPVTGVQIGLEALCATHWINPNIEDRFVYVIAHEYAHVQQAPELVDKEHPTVLEGSLIEGAAEFTAELISGSAAYSYFGALTSGREREIETAFAADVDKADLSDWLYNSTPEKPGDLGYWVGYRIVKSYYQRSPDKRQALREILQMTDPKAFLIKSGWHPGWVRNGLSVTGRQLRPALPSAHFHTSTDTDTASMMRASTAARRCVVTHHCMLLSRASRSKRPCAPRSLSHGSQRLAHAPLTTGASVIWPL